jgi:exodeoxyribonuclease VII large subunit
VQKSFDFGATPPDSGTAGRVEPPTLAVRELNALVKAVLEERVAPLWVEGEVTGWKRYASGHCYFCLRDADAQVSAVMFASDARRLPAMPEEGMRVRAFGRVSLYEKRGDFQFVVRRVEATGDGGLWRIAFDRLRRKLDAEGLLDAARKRPIPPYPRSVGVVTSPVGAAIHDILHVIRRRAPWTRVVLSPARVQGDGAAADVARALRRFTRAGAAVDVIIVGRGGGSVEDLWAFNEEAVARAIAESPAPVISAVGHEVDITIADLVADLRAPTPSAAAEHAVPDGAAIRQEMAAARARLARGLRRVAGGRRERVEAAGERIRLRLLRIAAERRRELERTDHRLRDLVTRQVGARRGTIGALAGRLHALSPLHALARGYAVPLDDDGHVLRHAVEFDVGASFRLRLTDGEVRAGVEGVTKRAEDGEDVA